jgi:hypothetical protein
MALLWLFGIALVLTPFATVYALLKLRTIRDRLASESEENSRRHSGLQHEPCLCRQGPAGVIDY